MAARGSPLLLTAGGIVALVAGFALAMVTRGQAGLTLVLGGVLLVFSAIGVVIEPGPTAA